VGDFSEIIEQGKSGYVLAENNADCLAQTLLAAFSSPTSLEAMGQYAHQLSETRYAWSDIALKTGDLYLGLAQPGRTGPRHVPATSHESR
jgi:glycosyltransferase involved in cell wall biosynthesis